MQIDLVAPYRRLLDVAFTAVGELSPRALALDHLLDDALCDDGRRLGPAPGRLLLERRQLQPRRRIVRRSGDPEAADAQGPGRSIQRLDRLGRCSGGRGDRGKTRRAAHRVEGCDHPQPLGGRDFLGGAQDQLRLERQFGHGR